MQLQKEGKAKSIGVSNFNKEHIQALMDAGLDKPAVNQFEIHPFHRQVCLISWIVFDSICLVLLFLLLSLHIDLSILCCMEFWTQHFTLQRSKV